MTELASIHAIVYGRVQGVFFRAFVSRRAEELGLSLRELPMHEYGAISTMFNADLYQVFDIWRSVNARSAVGGTAVSAVREQLELARRLLQHC